MRKTLFLAAALTAIATAGWADGPNGRPETGAFAPHIIGTAEEGKPEIHRPTPTSHDTATAGVGTLQGGADNHTINRTGAARGNLGFPQGAHIIGNEDGRPVVEYVHPPAGGR